MTETVRKETKLEEEASEGTDIAAAGADSSGQTAGRVHGGPHGRKTVRTVVMTVLIVLAAVCLAAALFLPVLRIYGGSMSDTLDSGDIVVSVRTDHLKTGDVIAFYYNSNILVKRIIARQGDVVDIDENGDVYVNDQLIEEPYISEKAYGETNIELPFEVPEGRIFVLGDNRTVSDDSRDEAIGCVSQEQILGRVLFRVWPLNRLGAVK